MRLIRPAAILAALFALAACDTKPITAPSALGASATPASLVAGADQQARISPDATTEKKKGGEDSRSKGPKGGSADDNKDRGGRGEDIEDDDRGKHDEDDDDDDDDKGKGSGRTKVSARLAANPKSIQSGQSSTLTWSSTNATSATLNGAMVAVSGSQIVSPTMTTTYTFIASGATGTATATATVTVATTGPPGPPAPNTPTAMLSANPLSIQSGQQSTLSWSSTNATSATLDGVAVSLSGTQMVSPMTTHTYTLVASGAGGSATATATVTVSATPPPPPPPPAPTLTFTADVEPILGRNCVMCHNTGFAAAGVDLSTFAGVSSKLAKLASSTRSSGSMYTYLTPTASHTKVQLSDVIQQWVSAGGPQ